MQSCNVTVELQATIQICQPHSKLKILSHLWLYCGSCVMMLSLSCSNKGEQNETVRQRYGFLFLPAFFFFLKKKKIFFSIYVFEMDTPSLPTRVMNGQLEVPWHKYTLVDSCRAVCFSRQQSNHFYPADFSNRNGHV